MSRAALILTAGLALAVPGLIAAGGGSVTGAPQSPATTTTTTTVAAPATSTTIVGATVPTTVPVATTVPRGGATSGSVAKPEPAEGWSIERLGTLTALAVVALAAVGYAVGRIRSTPPVHPDLVRRPE